MGQSMTVGMLRESIWVWQCVHVDKIDGPLCFQSPSEGMKERN